MKKDNILNLSIPKGYTHYDPIFAMNQANIFVSSQIFECLTQVDSQNNVIPLLSDTWFVNDENTIFKFHLKKQVRFSISELTLKASDVKFSLLRLLNPKNASPGAWLLNDILDSNSIQVVDSYTIQFSLKKRTPHFPEILAVPYCGIVSEKFLSINPSKIIGTGLFLIDTIIDNEVIALKKNKSYYVASSTNIDKVIMRFVNDKRNEYFDFLSGNLDYINGVDEALKSQIFNPNGTLLDKHKNKFQLKSQSFLNTEYLAFNLKNIPNELNSDEYLYLRKAINFAIDRRKLIQYYKNSICAEGQNGFTPPSLYQNSLITYYNYNPDSVLFYLDKIKKPLPTQKLFTTQSYLDICLFVQHELKKFNIPIEIENATSSFLSESKKNGTAQFFRGSWIADYADAGNFLTIFLSDKIPPNGPNYFRYQSAKFDKLIYQTDKVAKKNERLKLYQEAESQMMSQSPVIILYYDVSIALVNKSITGFKVNQFNYPILKEVIKKEPL